MEITVHGKHIDVGDSLTQHVETNLTEAAEKYFPNPIEATVLFSKEADHRIKSDITIHLGKDIVLKAHAEEGDAYGAFDAANEKLSTRMRRYKGKMKDHHRKIHDIPAERETPAVYKTLEALADDVVKEHAAADHGDTDGSGAVGHGEKRIGDCLGNRHRSPCLDRGENENGDRHPPGGRRQPPVNADMV